MTPRARWALVLVGAVALLAAPAVVRALPVADEDRSAAQVLEAVRSSADRPHVGYVESVGTLALPVADRFTDLGRLFGERTRLRVWWRGPGSWRVDRLTSTGETDLVHAGGHTTRWRYEQADVDFGRDQQVRLPRTSDLLPPALARLLLAGADPREVTRLPAERVARRTAFGIRLEPTDPRTSIGRVDVWADAETGVPLRVDVSGVASAAPALTSEFLDFSPETPAAENVGFVIPPHADVDLDPPFDLADAANRFADVVPPASLAGLPKAPTEFGAVGVYGEGVARVIAVPLWGRGAEALREQIRVAPGGSVDERRALLTVGPLTMLLTEEPSGSGWLVSGTVTADTLLEALDDLGWDNRMDLRP